MATYSVKLMRWQGGTSLIELVMSIVIISISVGGVIQLMTLTARHSADPMIQHQAVVIAQAYMEEILPKEFDPLADAGGRANYNDVKDYHGLTDVGAKNQTGAAIAGLQSYTINVIVNDALAGGWQGIPQANVYRVDVQVLHSIAGVNIMLSNYRLKF